MIGAYNLDRNDMTIGQISGDLIILEDEELLEEKIIELIENREP